MRIRTALTAAFTSATIAVGIITPAAHAATPKDSYIAMLKATLAQEKKTGFYEDAGYAGKPVSVTIAYNPKWGQPNKYGTRRTDSRGVATYTKSPTVAFPDGWNYLTPGIELSQINRIKTVTYNNATKTYTVTTSPGYYAAAKSIYAYTVGSNGLLAKVMDDQKPAWVQTFRWSPNSSDLVILTKINI
jgi:hypothetical protein